LDQPPSPPVETVEISRLFCSPTNPRHNDAAVPHVAASIRRFGWQQPIVARRSGEVIAGNTRLKAAQDLGMTEVPVWWFDGTDLDAVAFGIADNRTHTFSEFDEPALAKLLEQLKAEDALDGVGYSTEDIDALVQKLREEEEVDRQLADDGPDEPPAVAIAKTGDLWCLGEHRLLCGDSTSLKDVHRVMGNDKAALVATDPPYLVDYTGERPNDSGKGRRDDAAAKEAPVPTPGYARSRAELEDGGMTNPAERWLPGVADQLLNYVYLLTDPISGKPFYVGKGVDNRCFSHVETARRTEKDAGDGFEKLTTIRAIESAGRRVRIDTLRRSRCCSALRARCRACCCLRRRSCCSNHRASSRCRCPRHCGR
jgi:ParB-like chromosome segregation protein Spo0J